MLVRCQSSIGNCSSQVCWRQVKLHGLWLQKEEEDGEFDGYVSNFKMTRFGYYGVDLIRERHVRVKDEANFAKRWN